MEGAHLFFAAEAVFVSQVRHLHVVGQADLDGPPIDGLQSGVGVEFELIAIVTGLARLQVGRRVVGDGQALGVVGVFDGVDEVGSFEFGDGN